ncbi:dihydrofolate reductase family protein [Oceanirhabdus seepicola]|uniref:Dihydrofolate reductase family protein n=1 Tax=Oceanirhabdus seepicola TaxID=2828781 RepID=A0A9J6NYW4_9CLOT|nr:dihydrofolate reductase family protein [Oceanirhabdus seepicola]
MENYGNVEFISNDICGYIQNLQKEEGKDIWLFGGGGLTDCFIKADIVDEYIIGIIPIILGNGRPLFLGSNPTIKLHLDEYTVQDGITIHRYSKRV